MLFCVLNGELKIYKGDRMPIGKYYGEKKKFKTQKIQYHREDLFYMLSDGYLDQFGQKNGEKYMKKRFVDFILSVKNYPLAEQKEKLLQEFNEWKGTLSQLDDVLVIGFQL